MLGTGLCSGSPGAISSPHSADSHTNLLTLPRYYASVLELPRKKIKGRAVKFRIDGFNRRILVSVQPCADTIPEGPDARIRIITTRLSKGDLVENTQFRT